MAGEYRSAKLRSYGQKRVAAGPATILSHLGESERQNLHEALWTISKGRIEACCWLHASLERLSGLFRKLQWKNRKIRGKFVNDAPKIFRTLRWNRQLFRRLRWKIRTAQWLRCLPKLEIRQFRVAL
jgi:hypothetical protein